ncbi:sirohydrochlorin cobaltochelatase [Solidesulfovibrio sp.]|uniref:sirohydrochlorin cobaltochelatase n=1 Tax=Solidesulfovibrio sp. TaxID=2910990 RepID=UPI000EBFF9D4|nr:sirohydrochlorin cobaltochelatase [Solidesulfovibrio sp.]MEA5089330.1 sirohydrochlorin cobaltochelatase [Solidesulfovibrio sp.]HCR14083.1 sirohydrochlorin cobaltochelatase [Desulfovibrio sp.]HML60315.1 sirohydrochlorin cobaltochelatase [Solidesulfovibrio sp.]
MPFFKRILPCLTLCLLLAAPAFAGHDAKKEPKRAIVVAAFGTTVPEAAPAIQKMVERVKAAYPGVPVSLCYTASMIRHKLAKQGQTVPSPAEALAALPDQGVTDVALFSLQTIPGHEFNDLERLAQAFSGLPKGLSHVEVTAPLLFSREDFPRVAKALLASAPKDRKPGDALVFVGHGTDHPANMAYPALQYTLWREDKNAFVTTVEGTPSFEDLVSELKARGVKKAFLMPLFAVAGDHAHNDMAGKEDDSLASTLKKAGVESVPVMAGNGDREAVAAVWMDHLKTTLDALPGK